MKYLFSFLALLTTTFAMAQGGVLPFTGIVYAEHGIHAKAITAELEEATWTSNRLPVNAEFAVELEEPSGLVAEDGMYYPGIEVLLTSPQGDTLGYASDIFGDIGFPDMEDGGLDHLTLRLSFGEEAKPGDSCVLKARFFDKLSDNELRLSMLIRIAGDELQMNQTSSTYSRSGPAYLSMATEDLVSSFTVTEDHRHHRLDYVKLDAVLKGITEEEWANGLVSCYCYNGSRETAMEMEPVVTSAMVDGKLLVTAGVLLDPLYTFRLRWESRDGGRVVELLTR